MNSDKSFGFILKTDVSTGRCCLFSATMGKIHVINRRMKHSAQLTPGTEIAFTIDAQYPAHYVVSNVDIINTPLITHATDLLWLHHILELYYFFLPLGYGHSQEYKFLKNYTNLNRQMPDVGGLITDLARHVGVLHFLSQTGFYNDDHRLHRFVALFEGGLDQPELFADWAIESTDLAGLIMHYLRRHPQFSLFKTTQFIYALKQSRTLL